MPFIFTQPTGDEVTFIDQLRYIDSLTNVGFGGMFGVGFLLAIWATLFLVMKNFKSEHALAVSTMISAVIGLMLRILILTNDFLLYVSLIMLVVSVFFLKKDTSNYEV